MVFVCLTANVQVKHVTHVTGLCQQGAKLKISHTGLRMLLLTVLQVTDASCMDYDKRTPL